MGARGWRRLLIGGVCDPEGTIRDRLQEIQARWLRGCEYSSPGDRGRGRPLGRSQTSNGRSLRQPRGRFTLERMARLYDRWLVQPRLVHPYPSVRFDAMHPR
jgi:hypothetical protein